MYHPRKVCNIQLPFADIWNMISAAYCDFKQRNVIEMNIVSAEVRTVLIKLCSSPRAKYSQVIWSQQYQNCSKV